MTFLRRWLRVPMPPRTRANAQVDFLAAILYGAFGGLTLPFIPVMGRRLGATPLQVSLLVAAPAIVFLLSFWIVNAVRPVHPVRLVMWPALLGRLLFLFMPLIKTPAPYVALIVLYHGVSSINTLGYAQVMRAVYPDDVRATNVQVGLLGAVTSALWMLSFYSWGKMIDQRTATNTTKVVFAIGTLTPVVYFFSPNAWVVQLAGISDGLTSAGIDLGWLAAVLHYAPPGQVLHYVTLFNTLVGLRAATAPFIAGALIPSIGVRWIFAAAAVVQLTGMLLMRRVSAPGLAEGAAPSDPPSTAV